MTKVREFIKAYRYLEADAAFGRIGFIDYLFRKGMLEKVIDEERQPVADKAAKIWDGSTASQQYLKRHSADIIEASSDQPYRIVLASDVLGTGWLAKGIDNALYIRPCQTVINMNVSLDGSGVGLASEIAAVVMDTRYPLREECADAAQWLWNHYSGFGEFSRVDWLALGHAPQWIIDIARRALASHNVLREPVADAAWFLLEHGNNDWQKILKDRDSSHIVGCAYIRRDAIECDRLAAERLSSADKARELYLTHGYAECWLRAKPELIDEGHALAYADPRKRTRITINRLGTPDACGKVRFEFVLGGEVISSSMRECKICSGSPYVFYSAIVDFDSVTVTGDCDYKIERGASE